MHTHKKESYRSWYIAVVLVLVAQIALYYWFTQHYK